jgi:hypothetical protein
MATVAVHEEETGYSCYCEGTKMLPSNFKSGLWYNLRPMFGDFDRLAEIKV